MVATDDRIDDENEEKGYRFRDHAYTDEDALSKEGSCMFDEEVPVEVSPADDSLPKDHGGNAG